nr:hypothetical protein [Tanacetum cinerariifolium]
MVGVVVDLGIHGLGLVIVATGKKLVVVLVGVVETVPADGEVVVWLWRSSRAVVVVSPESENKDGEEGEEC